MAKPRHFNVCDASFLLDVEVATVLEVCPRCARGVPEAYPRSLFLGLRQRVGSVCVNSSSGKGGDPTAVAFLRRTARCRG